jgi:hypothetical protein
LYETNACNETNDTSEERPNTQLLNDTLKVGVVLPWGNHAFLPYFFCPTRTFAFRCKEA